MNERCQSLTSTFITKCLCMRHGNKLKESKDGVHRPLIVKFKHLKYIALFIILSCTSLVFNILEFQ